MVDAIANAGSTSAIENLYAHEVRFGVVMYGGVSLAIYINGVANELYEMALATPKAGDHAQTGKTRDVYRKASFLLRDQGLRESYRAHLRDPKQPDPFAGAAPPPADQRTRFVVDTIAGTSAGGINGVFLAKALVNGQEFAPLARLWIQEGDISGLLNDPASYDGIEFAKTDLPPQSLLNSDRMYVKLLDALRQMKRVEPAIAPVTEGGSPLVDEIDLYVTTTDIRGAVVPLRLFDKVVYEKRYKQVYHFQYSAYATTDDGKQRNDLAEGNNPFLAFAARCTSSFPFAFEPMSVADAVRLCNARSSEAAVDFDAWKPFFTGLSLADMTSQNWRNRAFGDGGYLDNKPFTYVVDALSWRLGGLPMDRKLIYVEPAPSHPENERQVYDRKPDAVENAVAAVFKIPQDETIREDIEAVLARNRRVERVERIVRQVEADIETYGEDPFVRIRTEDDEVPDWRKLGMSEMIAYYGVAFLPYRRLRMMSVTDDIADRLGAWWGIDRRSDRQYALRAIVRAWRESKYSEDRDLNPDLAARKETVNAFLDDYDVKYRLRRVGFLLRKVHQLLALAGKLKLLKDERQLSEIEQRLNQRCKRRKLSADVLSSDDAIKALRRLAHGFGKAMEELRTTTWLPAPSKNADDRVKNAATLDEVLKLLLGEKPNTAPHGLETADNPAAMPPADAPKVLETTADLRVQLPTDLPPPSPLRTLQENVFKRTEALYKLAAESPTTKVQRLLEEDVDLLRAAYRDVIRPTGKSALPRALLGNPKLRVEKGADDAKKVVISIDQVSLDGCEALNEPAGQAIREFLAEYYERFDEYDQMSFPLYYDTGTGEPATVEVLRISPEDAPSLINEQGDKDAAHQRRKLAGTALFHFGAFLDEKWRRNDIMWGRLDGCERILAALFPEDSDKDIREGLLQEAQRIIVREEMLPTDYEELISGFAQVLAEQKWKTPKRALEDLLAKFGAVGSPRRRTDIARILKALLDDAGTVDYIKRYYEVDRNLDTGATLKISARALTITGKILEDREKRADASSYGLVWLTRAGRGLQALLAVSTPGSLPLAIFRHWLALLYMFEALIIVGSMLLSSPSARNFGFTLFGLTLALNLANLLTGDLIGRKRGRAILFVALVGFVVLVLAALGAWALYSQGLHGALCVRDDLAMLKSLCRLF